MNINTLRSMDDEHLINSLESGELSDTEKLLIERLNYYIGLRYRIAPDMDFETLANKFEQAYELANSLETRCFLAELEELQEREDPEFDDLYRFIHSDELDFIAHSITNL